VLRIPREESSKNHENWTVSLTDRTTTALERWLDERENYGRYDDTDALWLTTRGNPYASKSPFDGWESVTYGYGHTQVNL
jgi:hypothetical protein